MAISFTPELLDQKARIAALTSIMMADRRLSFAAESQGLITLEYRRTPSLTSTPGSPAAH